MLILPQEVEVGLGGSNSKHFEEKGYEIPRRLNRYGKLTVPRGTKIKVNVLDLPESSKCTVLVKCEYCENNIEKIYDDYTRWKKLNALDKDCCKKCIGEKIKESNQKVYGTNSTMQVEKHRKTYSDSIKDKYNVDNINQLDIVKEKKINTSMNNWGVPYPILNNDIKEKVIITNNLRYGCDYPMQNEEIFKKACQTNVEKYGYERPSQNEEIKKIIKKTNFDKYGVESLFQNKEFREMIDNIIMDKYGVKNYTQTDEYKEKTIETCLEKYNTKHYSQSNEFKEKFKQTCLDKYGVEFPSQNEEIQGEIRQSFYKNGACQTSSQQLYIYNLLKDNGYNVKLNYPLSRIDLDIGLFIGVFKINI